MPGDSLPPNVPVLHDDDRDDDAMPPVRHLTRRFGGVRLEVPRLAPQPSRPPRGRADSVPPVGITIPPPAPSALLSNASNLASTLAHTWRDTWKELKETRAFNAVTSRVSPRAAVFGTAVVALLAIMFLEGRATSHSASASVAAMPPPVTAPTPTDAPPPAPITPPSRPADEEAPGPTPAVASARTVQIAFSADPPAAQFRVDDGPWLSNPSTHQMPKDDRPHRIAARADGYFPRFATTRFTEDMLVEVTLEKIAAWEAPARSPKAAKPELSTPKAPPGKDGAQVLLRPVEQTPYE